MRAAQIYLNRSAGWSLLELMITLVLSAGVALALSPNARTSHLKTDAKLLSEILRGIRHRAIIEHREFIVSFQNGICSVSPQQAGLSTICRRLIVPHPGSMTFFTNGVCTPTKLDLIENNTTCSVSIALRGRIRVSCAEI